MSDKQSILSKRAQFLANWGLLAAPPFRGVPPSDRDELLHVFVNRDEELERALLTLDEGENVLVRGMTGIGKTAFILSTLYQIRQQAEELNGAILPIHVRQFVGGSRLEMYRVVLYAIARQLAPRYKRAREIVYSLTGEEVTRSRSKGMTVGLEVQLPHLVKGKGEGKLGGDRSVQLAITDPEHFVDELLDHAITKCGYRRIVLAIDDLERAPNQGSIKTMLENSLDLVRDDRIAFMLTGRSLTILEDVYASGLDIFNETVALRPLTVDQLRMIAVRTLNLVRVDADEESCYPFSDDTIELMASRSFGIPRQFVLMCGRILKLAVSRGEEVITPDAFERLFEYYQDEIANTEVPPDIRRVLYLGLERGGFAISKHEDLDSVFSILGISTLREFVDIAENFVQQDLLQRFTDNRGDVFYRLVPGVEKLAASGELLLETGEAQQG